MSCLCRCHASGANVSCDHGPPQPGGLQSCTGLHDATPDVPLDEACVLGHAEPVKRYVGLLCSRHYHWIDRTLNEVLELSALLPVVLLPGPAGDIRSGTPDGSPAPGRLDVLALTDSRSKPWPEQMTFERNWNGRTLEPNGSDDVPDLPGTLASWARMVIEERETSDVLGGSIAASVRVLRRERLWIARQPWVDDYAAELAELHRSVARGVGDTMWRQPVGRCPNCQTPLFHTVGVDEVTCRRCRATWTGVHLTRLRLIFEQEGQRDDQTPSTSC